MHEQNPPSVSRRSFIRIATSTLMTLPAVAGGVLLPIEAEEAYAQETASVSDGSSAHVVILNPHEVAVSVKDASETAQGMIEDASVTLTSRYNITQTIDPSSLSDTTDTHGTCTFDITNLSEETGKQQDPKSYAFNGSIDIQAEGYRTVRIPLTRVEGGQGLVVGTHPLEDDTPYPVSIAFDEWDVLYTENEFIQGAHADYKVNHTITVQLTDLPDGTVSVFLSKTDSTTPIISASATASGGAATVELTGLLLWSDSSNSICMEVGGQYSVNYKVGDTTYVVDIHVTVTEAPAGLPVPQTTDSKGLAPFNDTSMFETGVHFPSDFPLLGGS